LLSKKFNQLVRPNKEPGFRLEDRGAIIALLEKGVRRGVSANAIADLFGLATHALQRKGSANRFSPRSMIPAMPSSRLVRSWRS
jgi:hypothetical protein